MKRFLVVFCFLNIFNLSFSFGKNKVVYNSYNWNIIETKHLLIYLPDKILFLSNKIAFIGESIFDKHSKTYDYKPATKIKIVIFPDFNDFLQNNILDWTSSQVKGFTEFLKGRVVIYYSPDYNEFYHFFAHELNHAFQVYYFGKGEANIYSMRNLEVPLWFIEGSSEYNSIGLDEECENIIAEGLYNGILPSLLELSDLMNLPSYKYYYVYKMGQMFYYFLEKTYGEEIIKNITKDIVESRNFEKSLKKFTEKELKEVNEEFFHFLRSRYYTNYINLDSIDVIAKKITKDRGFFRSPVDIDGTNLLIITESRFTPSLVIYDRNKHKKTKLISTYRNEEFFEFLYDDNNNIGLSEDQKVVFITRSKGKNQLYVYDLKNRKANKIKLPFSIITSPDISKDGKKIVFSAINENFKRDIYLYEIETKKLLNLTEDSFVDDEPRFVDDENIIFISDRRDIKNIYFLNISSKTITRYLSIGKNVRNPSVKGSKILFVSVEAFPSIYLFDIKENKLYKEISPVGRIENPSFSKDEKILFSIYKDGAHGIYEYKPILSNSINDFELKNYERVAGEKEDDYDISFKVKNYSLSLTMDYLVGGAALNSMLGLGAIGITSFSDILGNHRYFLWFDTGIFFREKTINNVNVDFSYYYLRYRHNFGFRIFHYSTYFYEFYTFRNFFEVEKSYFRTLGVYGLYSFPFSTFNRVDVSIGVRQFEYISNLKYNQDEKKYSYDLYPKYKNTITVDYVYDTSLSDYTGPVDGMRFLLSTEQAFDILGDGFSYTKFIIDLRNYFLIYPGYSIATRVSGGKIVGRDESEYNFYLGGFNSLRGYDLFAFSGNTMFLMNFEFRFPLITYWQIGFPFPLRMPTIWGSIFYDMGGAFNWGRDFVGYEIKNDTFYFRDLKCSFGIGLRLVIAENIKLFYDLAAPYDGSGFPSQEKWNSFWFIGIDF